MKKTFLSAALAVCAVFSMQAGPKKIGIVAHRGFWKCEAAGFSENSLASLAMAQQIGLWGSECDVHLTSDNVVIVNHDPYIKDNGKKIMIAQTHYEDLSKYRLPNGESRPKFEAYIDQYKTNTRTRLVVELKKQQSPEREAELVSQVVKILKDKRIFKPSKIIFISFSRNICDIIARDYPKFTNQFLADAGKKYVPYSPAEAKTKAYNGIDYHYKVFRQNPSWPAEAKKLGLSVNVWTVNKETDIKEMISLPIDQITTNEPLLVRQMLGKRER